MIPLGCAIVGAGIGLTVGFWIGEREGGDFNVAPFVYAPVGAALGAIIGAGVGGFVS